MPEPIGEPLYEGLSEVDVAHGYASSDVWLDADDAPAIYLPGRGGWTRRELTPPRRPIGFSTRPRRAPHTTSPKE